MIRFVLAPSYSWMARFILPRLLMICGAGIGLSVLLLDSSVVVAQEQLPTDAWVSQLRSALSRYNSVEFTASAYRRSSGSAGSKTGEMLTEEQQAVFRHIGSRVLLSIKSKYTNPSKSAPSFNQTDLIVSEDGDVLDIYAPLDPSYQQTSSNAHRRLGLLLHSQRVAATQERDRDSVLRLPIEFASVAWFIGGVWLLDYIDSATESSSTEVGDEVTISATSELGKVQFSLSRRHGSLPRTFKVVKGPQDKYMQGEPETLGERYAKNAIEFESTEWDGEVLEFAKDKNDLWFAKKVRLTQLSKFRNRPEGRTDVQTDVEELLFSPAFDENDFRSTLTIPVGHKVTVAGAAYLPYQWDGTKAVPGLPEAATQPVRILANSRGSLRAWLIAINCIGLVLILGVLVWRRRPNNRT